MTDLIPILRLWSGNKTNWLYGEGYNYDSHPSEVLHQSPVVSGYSEATFYYGWSTHIPGYPSVTLSELAASDFPKQARVLNGENIREHIDGFVDACRTSQFRQTKAIIAATLLDALAKQYANVQGKGKAKTMRNRVDLLSDELALCMNSKLRCKVVKVRNSLVHEGCFPDNKRSLADCNRLLWMNFVALCRLVGYEGELPPPPTTE